MNTELSNLLLRGYTKILETGEFYDIEILVGEQPNTKIFRLHSFVLKVCSPYFRTALSSNWIKIENNIIKFKKPNISVKVFDILTKFIYSGKLELENNNVKTNVALLIAADELCLSDLCIYIEKCLLKNVELLKQNFVLIQDISNKFTQFIYLSQFYNDTFQKDPSLIFKANDFTTIKKEILLDIIANKNHFLNPIEIWDKLMEWAIDQSNELPSDVTKWTDINVTIFKKLIQPFISHINFQEITRVDFFQKIKPFKNVFDDKFYIKILEHYSFNNIHDELMNSPEFISEPSMPFFISPPSSPLMPNNSNRNYNYIPGRSRSMRSVRFNSIPPPPPPPPPVSQPISQSMPHIPPPPIRYPLPGPRPHFRGRGGRF
ncbi:uncharacterized protein OCT59_019989 [Rhizophagus irregularis]|uniref:BTB/POZ protein n=1 Tax=Rhizophagus irregularis (strain DAOM 181602 / DAOM 197198 / MUCL 43194) TaxID=747089 RepID=U9TQC6_RHIID|nr:BTB/POZ protein [Rhizophagus irregularis DAOM 181602=DAOM 197198]POG59120.1 BTB/POZ protein [Rhizophagus irregularis DAOM 181602=DAOM 197198]UZO27802.1 hypothetical protein OCT59_019989 [Rhizophagus irregularis]GBC25558.1 BTB/POZ protein [Rhizophagus irregularis DAOM 181602=DAOM 197198]|eukprot:XP_025165986.1 BTB/POZ protein [Rhizophagus irregularis DAOM 181602=DAOM 197198]